MRIQINKFWQNTSGVKVNAGEYEESDLPDGIAQYLVENGHATVVGQHAAQAAPQDKPAPQPKRDPIQEIQRAQREQLSGASSKKVETNTDTERESLIAEYEALTGESPAWNIGLDTLKARLAELRESEG